MVLELVGGRVLGSTRYCCVEPPGEARVRRATKLLKRVALFELLPAGKRTKADVAVGLHAPPSCEAESAGAQKHLNLRKTAQKIGASAYY